MLSRRAGPHFVGILGWPLEHTLSPAIHTAAFRRMGLDWIYLAWPVRPEALGDAVAGLRALGARGANVTMPHKETVIPFLDRLSGDAEAVGAVNTIQEMAGEMIGHNTDVDGLREFLSGDIGMACSGKSALVLGAGGAARATVKALHDLGVGSIMVHARDRDRAAALTSVSDKVNVAAWADRHKTPDAIDLVVNATPVGTGGGDPPLEASYFRRGHVVVDLVYDPPHTPLVQAAKAGGADAWGGIGMLVHQGAAAFRIWTGQDPPLDAMSAAAIHALGGPRLHR